MGINAESEVEHYSMLNWCVIACEQLTWLMLCLCFCNRSVARCFTNLPPLSVLKVCTHLWTCFLLLCLDPLWSLRSGLCVLDWRWTRSLKQSVMYYQAELGVSPSRFWSNWSIMSACRVPNTRGSLSIRVSYGLSSIFPRMQSPHMPVSWMFCDLHALDVFWSD